MRTPACSGLAHNNVSAQRENRVFTRETGYAQGLCVAHANLSELAVPRINAWRITASRYRTYYSRQHRQGITP